MMNGVKAKIEGRLELLFKERGNLKKFKNNEIIFLEEDKEDCLFYIESGLVKLSMISNEGKEKTLFLLSGGHFFGEVSLGDGLKYLVNAETISDTSIYTITYKELREILLAEPELAFELLRVMSEKMRLITQQIKDMVFYDITGRLASQIMLFCQQFGYQTEEGIVINLVLTHQELANILGASRVTVTKTLNQFQEENLIKIVNRKIIVLDMEKLSRYVSARERD